MILRKAFCSKRFISCPRKLICPSLLINRTRAKANEDFPDPLSPTLGCLATHLRACKIGFEQEYKFHPKRKWRADFLIIGTKILIDLNFLIEIGLDHLDQENNLVISPFHLPHQSLKAE